MKVSLSGPYILFLSTASIYASAATWHISSSAQWCWSTTFYASHSHPRTCPSILSPKPTMYDAHHAYHHRVQQCLPHTFPVRSATCCTISDDDAATSSERRAPRLRRRSRTTRADGSHIAGCSIPSVFISAALYLMLCCYPESTQIQGFMYYFYLQSCGFWMTKK
jgi:hypothetical protein